MMENLEESFDSETRAAINYDDLPDDGGVAKYDLDFNS